MLLEIIALDIALALLALALFLASRLEYRRLEEEWGSLASVVANIDIPLFCTLYMLRHAEGGDRHERGRKHERRTIVIRI